MEPTEFEQLNEKLDKTLIAVRDSAPPSLSHILIGIKQEMFQLRNEIAEIRESVKPAVQAIETANGLRRGIIWVAGFLLASGTITAAIYAFKEWIKK